MSLWLSLGCLAFVTLVAALWAIRRRTTPVAATPIAQKAPSTAAPIVPATPNAPTGTTIPPPKMPTFSEPLLDVFDYAKPSGAEQSELALVNAVGRTDRGKRRKHNEDAYLVMNSHDLFAIADGMGGYAAGEIASQLAVDTMKNAFETNTFFGESNATIPLYADELVRSFRMANRAIFEQAQKNEDQSGMGTTLVGLRFSRRESQVFLANVGDSRCYRLRDGRLEQMTRDHTLGTMGIVGPTANRLSRAVGIGANVEIDVRIDRCTPTDIYVLCSDGLSKMVSDEMIAEILESSPEMSVIADRLVEVANDHGGRDNVTVIVIRVDHSLSGRVVAQKSSAQITV
jgi:protein phosphatase